METQDCRASPATPANLGSNPLPPLPLGPGSVQIWTATSVKFCMAGNKRDRPRRGGFGRKLRGAWKEARALGLRAAVGAVRSDPAELKRLAMAKLERGHWRARARIGQHHTYKAVAAETEAGHVYGRADVEAHRAARGMQAVERQGALTFPPTLSPPCGPRRPVGPVRRTYVRKGEPPRRTAGDGPLTALRAFHLVGAVRGRVDRSVSEG